MVESGQRFLSPAAQKKFNELVYAETANKIEDFSSVNQSVNQLINDHVTDLDKSIEARIGDLSVLLYNATKRIKKWKGQTDYAICELIYIKEMDAHYADRAMPPETISNLIGRRYRAEATIRTVLRSKPEMLAAKIIAFSAELEYLTKGKGNVSHQIGFDMKQWMIELPKTLGPSKATE